MRIQNQYIAFSASLVIGILLGLVGGPVYILLPWGLVGLAIGYVSTRKNTAILNGAVYGFLASFTFMVSGYAGQDSVATKILPFIIIGLVGALCGLTLGLLGNIAHRKR